MKQSEEWFIYIEDHDQKKYCVVGPVTADNWSDWFDVIENQQNAGGNLLFQEIQPSQLSGIPGHARSQGLSKAEVSNLIETPKDRSAEYRGSLPQYAKHADRSKLVQMLCKGKCCKTRCAELNKQYPGKDELRKARHGEYQAICLKCGYEATYNYNWFRP